MNVMSRSASLRLALTGGRPSSWLRVTRSGRWSRRRLRSGESSTNVMSDQTFQMLTVFITLMVVQDGDAQQGERGQASQG